MGSLHHHDCDCPAHREHERAAGRDRAGLWAGFLTFLACAVCPACMATYAKLLSLVGVGLELTELQHSVVLGIALVASVVVSGFRSVRTRRAWPLVFALAGTTLVLWGHLHGDLHAVEWAGVLTLLVSGVVEQVRLRRLTVATA